MSTTFILTRPPDYDLQALAETTRNSLALLKPWTLLDTSNDPLAAQIVSQAEKYVSAIQLGVSAAYSGFTVTEEVLFLAGAMPIEDKEDLQDYLVGMMDLAREARENSNKAYQAFRNVRQEIFMTMNTVREENNSSQDHNREGSTSTHHNFPQHSEDDIEVLVKFSETISGFANWWDWVKIEAEPNCVRTEGPILFQLDTLQDPNTVKRWNNLRTQYTAYVQMISELEDANPSIFKRATSPDGRRASRTPSIPELNKVLMITGDIPRPEPNVIPESHPETVSNSESPVHHQESQEHSHPHGPNTHTHSHFHPHRQPHPHPHDGKTKRSQGLGKRFLDHISRKSSRLFHYIRTVLHSKRDNISHGERVENFHTAGWNPLRRKTPLAGSSQISAFSPLGSTPIIPSSAQMTSAPRTVSPSPYV